jgi:hypothetical protein
MCRKDLSVKPTPKSKSPTIAPVTIPYSPQRTPDEETGQQITYQEFIDTVTQSNSYQHTRNIEVHPSIRIQQQPQQQQVVQKPISKFKKCLKIVLCLVIIIVIIVVFITVV